MMPTIVQRPKILDTSEIQSSTLRVICYYLEVVDFKILKPTDVPIAGILWGMPRGGFHSGSDSKPPTKLCPAPQHKA